MAKKNDGAGDDVAATESQTETVNQSGSPALAEEFGPATISTTPEALAEHLKG